MPDGSSITNVFTGVCGRAIEAISALAAVLLQVWCVGVAVRMLLFPFGVVMGVYVSVLPMF